MIELDFYRIECEETGLGPYQSGEYGAILSQSSERHPTPWNEKLWDPEAAWDDDSAEDQRSFVCGFKSMEQLIEWFDVRSLRNIHSSGSRRHRHYNVIHFKSLECHMRIGKKQAIARKPYLREVFRQPLDEFVRTVEFNQIPQEARALTYEFESVKLGV